MKARRYTTADSLTLLIMLALLLFAVYQRSELIKQLEAERKDTYALRVQILRDLQGTRQFTDALTEALVTKTNH